MRKAGLLFVYSLTSLALSSRITGVHPSLAPKYVPVKSKSPESWKCLDGSREILFSAINDDYCDCTDGSDEPGTGACPNTTFYCVNAGHFGSVIPSSRVRDGLCEPECCDGSDELPGTCPNKCKEIGEAYGKKVAAENKIRKTGSKIRSTYIAFAQKEKKRIEASLEILKTEISKREKDVARLKEIKEHSESLSEAEMELKKQSPLYQSLQTHKNALKSFNRVHEKLKQRDEALRGILNGLRDGYNPNYQDMAVLEAVRGWETLEGLPPKGHEGDDQPETQATEKKEEEELEAGAWTEGQLEHQLSGVIDQDYLALLLSHETYLETLASAPSIMDLASYLPEAWMPHYISFKGQLLGALRTVGIIHGGSGKSEQAAKAMKEFDEAEAELKAKVGEKDDLDGDLKDLFDPEVFGEQGEWKKLDNQCLQIDTGEYTYEICLFGSAAQKSKNGGHQNLGQFEHWNTDVEPSDPKYYTKQYYKNGTQCWNGPQRSVTVEFKCGTDNVLLMVSEPEKCEYYITAETPALCLPLPADSTVKEDL